MHGILSFSQPTKCYQFFYFHLSYHLHYLSLFLIFLKTRGTHKNKTAGGEKSKGKQLIIPCSLVPSLNGNILVEAHACFSIVSNPPPPPPPIVSLNKQAIPATQREKRLTER